MGGRGFFSPTPSCFNCCCVWSFLMSTLVVFCFLSVWKWSWMSCVTKVLELFVVGVLGNKVLVWRFCEGVVWLWHEDTTCVVVKHVHVCYDFFLLLFWTCWVWMVWKAQNINKEERTFGYWFLWFLIFVQSFFLCFCRCIIDIRLTKFLEVHVELENKVEIKK
jgi:hypothetical protein